MGEKMSEEKQVSGAENDVFYLMCLICAMASPLYIPLTHGFREEEGSAQQEQDPIGGATPPFLH